MKLIVTEKNQTARRIAEILSGGKAQHEGGPRSTVYGFDENGGEVKTVGMRGHVLQVDFPEEYRSWQEVSPRSLVDAQIIKLSLIHISEPTRLGMISYAVFCLKK